MIYRQLLEGQCEIDNRRRSGTAIVLMSRLYARAISPPKLALTSAKTTPPGLGRRQYTWFPIRAAPADEIGGRLQSQRAQCTDESPDGVRIGETTAARRKVVLLSQLCPVSCKLTYCQFHWVARPLPEATYCGHDNQDARPLDVHRRPAAANDLRGTRGGIFTNGKVKHFYKERLSSTIRWPAAPPINQ